MKEAFSVIITARNEEKTIGQAIEAVLKQVDQEAEVLVVAPDKPTLEAAEAFLSKSKFLRVKQDPGQGKPAALNFALKEAKGKIVVLTDGDVYVDDQAIFSLLELFKDPQVGLVSGRPISLEDKDNLFGFWSHVLTNSAHEIRSRKSKTGEFLEASGYLYAFRKNLVTKLPKDALAEDLFISQLISSQGYKTVYAPEAKVYVKYPANYADWLKQKIRSTGGTQHRFGKKLPKMRSFRQELRDLSLVLSYPKNFKEVRWILLLLLARLDLWVRILIKVKLQKRNSSVLWQRVESTK